MTLNKDDLKNDQLNPEVNDEDELVANIDEICIEDDLTDFVQNDEPSNEEIIENEENLEEDSFDDENNEVESETDECEDETLEEESQEELEPVLENEDTEEEPEIEACEVPEPQEEIIEELEDSLDYNYEDLSDLNNQEDNHQSEGEESFDLDETHDDIEEIENDDDQAVEYEEDVETCGSQEELKSVLEDEEIVDEPFEESIDAETLSEEVLELDENEEADINESESDVETQVEEYEAETVEDESLEELELVLETEDTEGIVAESYEDEESSEKIVDEEPEDSLEYTSEDLIELYNDEENLESEDIQDETSVELDSDEEISKPIYEELEEIQSVDEQIETSVEIESEVTETEEVSIEQEDIIEEPVDSFESTEEVTEEATEEPAFENTQDVVVEEEPQTESVDDNIVKVNDAEPIISDEYKPFDTFVERDGAEPQTEELTEDSELVSLFAKPTEDESTEEEISEDPHEINDELEELDKVEDDQPLLDEEEMELPERFKRMLEESRMEKRGLVQKEEPKKKKKKSKVENVLPELGLEMTEEAIELRLTEFEQYFYDYIINIEEKSNTYEGSYYEAKYDHFIDLAEHGHDLNEYINKGFDAWLAKNYKLYKFKGKAKKIKEGFDDLKNIPRFNNREILPYLEKRGRLVIEFLNEFNNDVYLNTDKLISAKKHSLYPTIEYEHEMVCFEYLKSIEVENLDQYAEKFYKTNKQETIEFVESTREYLDPLSIDYDYNFKQIKEKSGYKQSKKICKAGWGVSIWMLILCAIVQIVHFVKLPFEIVNEYTKSINDNYLVLTLMTAGVIVLNIILLLPSRIKNYKVYKYERSVDTLVARRNRCRILEKKLASQQDQSIEYLKMINKNKKNKIRVNEKELKESAVEVVDDCAKLRHKPLPSAGLSKFLQFIFVLCLGVISSVIYVLILKDLVSGLLNIELPELKKLLIYSAVTSFVSALLVTITTRKKSLSRWRYHVAVLIAVVATVICGIIL